MFRPTKVRHYLAIMAEKGFAPDAVLSGTGLRLTDLHDPSYLIDVPQLRAVVSNIIELTGDQGIGLELGARTTLRDLGIVGHALLSAVTVRQSVQYWLSYSNALVGVPTKVSLVCDDQNAWTLRIAELTPIGFLFNFCVEEMLAMFVHVGARIVERPLVPASLELSYPAPAHQDRYAQIYPCPTKFNARHCQVTFSSPPFDQAVRAGDPDFHDLCIKQCALLTRSIERNGSIAAHVKNIVQLKPGEPLSLVDVADDLGMSTRTLRRRLQQEGLSFSQAVKSARADIARECLSGMHMSPKEAAYFLGFSDVGAFRRAFRQWTGEAVGDFLGKTSDSYSVPAALAATH